MTAKCKGGISPKTANTEAKTSLVSKKYLPDQPEQGKVIKLDYHLAANLLVLEDKVAIFSFYCDVFALIIYISSIKMWMSLGLFFKYQKYFNASKN